MFISFKARLIDDDDDDVITDQQHTRHTNQIQHHSIDGYRDLCVIRRDVNRGSWL